VLVSQRLAAETGHGKAVKCQSIQCHIHRPTKTTRAMIYKWKLITTSIKHLFPEFPELILLIYDYVIPMSVLGPLRKHRLPVTKSRSTTLS
jgi:hypothetical protein